MGPREREIVTRSTQPTFDRAYFDTWYRNPHHRVHDGGVVRRHAALAVAVAEFLLEHPIRGVLDIGCGEGAWRRGIRALRPRARYLGLDPSGYAAGRFGARRNIRHGTFGDIGSLPDLERFDLVICVDVLHYVAADEVERGARALGRRFHGVALLHAFTRDDDVEGDPAGYMNRSGHFYRRVFRAAHLLEVGLGFWVGRAFPGQLASLEGLRGR